MKTYQNRPQPRRVLTSIRCDVCNKEDSELMKGWEFDVPDGWHSFASSHSDWGNDSIESFDEHDVCSGSCYLARIREVLDDYGRDRNAPTLRVDGHDIGFVISLLSAVEASK